MTTGTCRWCHCREAHACPGGCAWANRDRTICTACVNIDREWKALQGLQRKPNMVRAFFRGFTAATDDDRAVDHGLTNGRGERAVPNNPYPNSGRTHRYWRAGYTAGSREAR